MKEPRGIIHLRDEETTIRLGSGMTTLAICGDQVVGQALTLLLRGSGYEAQFVPPPALLASSEPFLPKGTDLLVLTPTPLLSPQ